jgi:predicted nucleic acid-binding protein
MGGSFSSRRNRTAAGENVVTYLTLDSSIIIAALRKQESKHSECRSLVERVKDGEFIALKPYTVLVEVVAAIRRRTRDKDLASRVRNDLQDIETLNFLEFTSIRAKSASAIAEEIGVRGMDAIVIQIANEFNIPLISLDADMIGRAKSLVKIELIENL